MDDERRHSDIETGVDPWPRAFTQPRPGEAANALFNEVTWLRLLADSLPQIIWTNDGHGVANYFNKRWYEYTGCTYGESAGLGWQVVVHPDDEAVSTYMWNDSLENGKTFEVEYRLRSHDGEYRWFIGRNNPVRTESGKVLGWFGTATDIQDLKRAQVTASQSAAHLRATVESAADFAIITIDPDGVIVGWNSGAERAFGYTESEAIGMPSRQLFTREDREAHLPELEMARALELGRAEDERWHRHRSGARLYMSGVMTPIRSDVHAGFVKVARDMTERREADEALRESEARYRELVGDLSRTKEALMAADRQKDQFIATLAHELRNPLAPVRSAMQLISMTGSQDPQVLWALDIVNRQTNAMTRLIDDLMDVSRISQNKLSLRTDRVNLSHVLRDAIDSTRPLIDAQRQTLTVHTPTEPVELIGDQTRLSQIFANLLDNAAKYTAPGGAITLTATIDKSTVVVRITDTGIGIAQDDLGRIFTLFAQVRTIGDRGKGGLGIGLSLVQQLVRMHGGIITAHSEGDARGSEFAVTLPLAKGNFHPIDVTQTPLLECFSFFGVRMLIVDDNVDAANSLNVLLTQVGATVRTAYDGLSALEVAEEMVPHVMLLDIGLPNMSGHQVASHIRQQSWGHDVILIAISGWGNEQDKRDSYAAGFDRHIVKPAEPTRLMRVISELLNKGE